MSNINNGGPAFPPSNPGYAHGMTLRDYFAAAALTGSLAQGFRGRMCEEIVTKCYDMADAMLRAREA
jgi:hypothetical protein